MNKRFPLLLMMLALGFASLNAYGQSSASSEPRLPVGPAPDNKMLGGTSVGSSLGGISATDLFSGAMNIKVPVYNYNQTDFGVSLSYNTHGVKVDELEGPAGLHWDLDCGGSIVRIIRDLPDEVLCTTDSLLLGNLLGDLYHETGPRILVPNKEMHIYGKLSAYSESPAKLNAGNAYVDHECDEFIVSIPGMSFRFYIGKNLKIFTSASKNINVQLLADSSPITNISQFDPQTQSLNFKITDNKGDQFYFQPYISDVYNGLDKFWDWANLLSDTVFTLIPGKYTINWRLKKILLANGRAINYQYTDAYEIGSHHSYFSRMAYLNYFVQENGIPNGSFEVHNWGPSGIEQKETITQISEIDYPDNVHVQFQYDSLHGNVMGRSFIREIKILSGDNCTRFRLCQTQDPANQRYYLDSIIRLSCDGSKKERYYSFTYDPVIEIRNISLPGYPPVYDTLRAILPKRLNAGQDLFGFYNSDSIGVGRGAGPMNIGGDVTIPRHHPDLGGAANYGSDREYDARYAQAGLLTSVKNAYGGEEYFYYGPNVISSIPLAGSIPTDNSFIGADQPDGVRVDSTIRIDPALPGERLLTTFSYSGGQIFMPGGYFHFPVNIDSATGGWRDALYQGKFQTCHQLVNGANHGYSTVDVKNYTDGTLLSRRVTSYTNMQDATSGNQPRYYKVPGSMDYFQFPYTNKQYLKDWEIGLPLSVTDYDQNNRIVKKTINNYNFPAVDLSASAYISDTNLIKVNSGTRIDGASSGFVDWIYPNKKIFADHYYPYKGKATLASTVTQKYITDSRLVTDTVWYVYDSRNNLKSTVTQDSRGDKIATELVYNYDVDGPQYASGHFPGYTAHPGTTLYNMTAAGLELPVSTERWKLLPGTAITDPYDGAVLQNNNRLLSAFITGYQLQDGKLWTKGLWNTQTGSPLSYTQYTGLLSGATGNPYEKVLAAYNSSGPVTYFRETSQVTLFDAKGNPLETQMQGQDLYKAMIWDTATGQRLAEAANCRYSDIAYTSFEHGLPEGNLTGNKSYTSNSPSPGAVTGSHVGLLWTQTIPGTAVSFTGTQNLEAGKQYILSFWVYGTPPHIYVGSQVVPVSSANLAYTKGSWQNYQARFTPSAAGKLKITGTAANSMIDEVRLFPADARMQSRTYEPLFGKSAETDPSGNVIYYRYDPMGRQDLILDQDGNVLFKTDYHVAQ